MSGPTTAIPPSAGEHPLATLAGKYLTFKLAGANFGIQILKVREIIGRMEVTPVPGAPEMYLGVLNLRGKIIPVMDLARRFGLSGSTNDSRNCIVVTEVRDGDRLIDMGVLVDAVSEVLTIPAADLEPRPTFGSDDFDASFILALAKAGAEVKVLLDIDAIVLNTSAPMQLPALSPTTAA